MAFFYHIHVSQTRQNFVNHFQIQSASRDGWGVSVFLQDGAEASHLAIGAVHPLGGIAFGRLDQLTGFAACFRNDLVSAFFRLVDQTLFFLLGLVHLVERWFHRIRRGHVLQLDCPDPHAHLERVQNLLQLVAGLAGNLHAFFREYVGA